MSRCKGIGGIPDLMIFAIIVAITLSFLYFLSMVPVINNFMSLKVQAQIFVSMDDRGGALVSLLQTKNTGDNNSYAEIMGMFSAKGRPDNVDASLAGTIKAMEAGVEIYDGSRLVKVYRDMSGYTLSADIAMPGGRKGEVTVS